MSSVEDDLLLVEEYFRQWKAWRVAMAADGGLKPGWKDQQPPPPIAAMQTAALHHPNGRIRRDALTVLDHEANDDSVEVFRDALSDPVPRVRTIALHGLSCERCRETELCVTDVVPALAKALRDDPSASVRHDTVAILLRLSSRDERARDALAEAADNDSDALVRHVARAAVEGRVREVKSRKALRRRARRTAVGSG
jgi:HEAT repeat protein